MDMATSWPISNTMHLGWGRELLVLAVCAATRCVRKAQHGVWRGAHRGTITLYWRVGDAGYITVWRAHDEAARQGGDMHGHDDNASD